MIKSGQSCGIVARHSRIFPPPPHTADWPGLTFTKHFSMAERFGILRYGGTPRDLPTTALPTHSDIARSFYKACDVEKKSAAQVGLVQGQLENSWNSCCPELPVMPVRTVFTKILRFCDKLKKINRSKQSSKMVSEMDTLKNKLFDISACSCTLPQVECANNRVHCRVADCAEEHFVCDCPPERRVPVADRAYLSDQRSKIGTHGGAVQRRRAHFAAVREHRRFMFIFLIVEGL